VADGLHAKPFSRSYRLSFLVNLTAFAVPDQSSSVCRRGKRNGDVPGGGTTFCQSPRVSVTRKKAA
jgi:hypothetical protein